MGGQLRVIFLVKVGDYSSVLVGVVVEWKRGEEGWRDDVGIPRVQRNIDSRGTVWLIES